MPIDVLPILSTLRRHRLTATLLVLQIALTCAIVCNATFLIGDRLGRMLLPSGIPEEQLMRITVSDIGDRGDAHARAITDLAALRKVSGVEAVTIGNSLPFGSSSWTSGIRLDPAQKTPITDVGLFYGEDLSQVLGLRLVAGRRFNTDEYVWIDDHVNGRVAGANVALVTVDLAKRLFPEGEALGRQIVIGKDTMRIVGIVERLAGASPTARDEVDDTVVLPWRMLPLYGGGYFIRAQPGRAAQVLADAVATLKAVDPRRVIVEARLYLDIRARFFASDRAMALTLGAVSIALLIVTALGIVGLASFWVAQRRRQIGIRRALGASRADILRYFQTENFLLATMGIVIGMVLAYGVNLLLMRQYELPRLPLLYLPVGAAVLWALGQIAVLAPALRAASVPPVVATRG